MNGQVANGHATAGSYALLPATPNSLQGLSSQALQGLETRAEEEMKKSLPSNIYIYISHMSIYIYHMSYYVYIYISHHLLLYVISHITLKRHEQRHLLAAARALPCW